jgi:hypothetical protein
MSGIILSNYPVLSRYAILSSSGITTVNTTTIANGFMAHLLQNHIQEHLHQAVLQVE